MKTRKTIRQKNMEAERSQDVEEIQIPSWYSPAIGEVLKKTLPKHDEHLNRLHGETVKTLGENREDLERANKVQQTGLADPTQTRTGALVTAYEFAQKAEKRIFGRTVSLKGKIDTYSDSIDREIEKTLATEARQNRYDAEVRAHLLHSLKSGERMPFLRNAIREMDNPTVVSVLDAPPAISGISDDDKTHLLEEYKRKRFVPQMQAKTHLGKLKEALENGHGATLENIKVLDTAEVKQAIKLRDKAKKALV